MPPPMTSGLWWFQAVVAMLTPGPRSLATSSSKRPKSRLEPCPCRWRPTWSWRLPRPCGSAAVPDARRSRAVSIAPAERITSRARGAVPRQAPAGILDQNRHPGHPAVAVGGDPLDHRMGDEIAGAGRQRAGQHGVLRAVLAVARAREADAGAALDAGAAPGAGYGVDQERRGQRRDAQRLGAARQDAAAGTGRHRRHRIVARAGPEPGGVGAVARDADLPFRALVPGRQIRRRRSASRSARSRRARRRCPPCENRRAGSARPARRRPAFRPRRRRRCSGSPVGAVGGCWASPSASTSDARVAVDVGTGIVAVGREALVSQMVAVAEAGVGFLRSALQQEHAAAGLGQHRGGDQAACAGADDDAVIVRPHHPSGAGGPDGPSGRRWR